MPQLWINPDAGIYAIVDEEDYAWAVQWVWHITFNQSRTKMYATRMTSKTNKVRRKQIKIYLHKEILKRKGDDKPSRQHKLGDHINGDSLDCRRDNLRWATHTMNNRNRKSPKLEVATEVEIPF